MALQGVSIQLDRARTLRYDINALAELEELNDNTPLSAILTQRLGIKAIRDLLWCGLKHEDRRLTRQRVGEIMQAAADRGDGADLVALMGSITQALRLCGVLPAEEGAPAGNAAGPSGAPGEPASG